MKKIVITVLSLILIVSFCCSCKNDFTNLSDEKPNFSEADNLNLAQYDNHGEFSEGLCWVEKDGYDGKEIMYINNNGEIVIGPFTNIDSANNFSYGHAEIIFGFEGYVSTRGVIDLNGNVVFKYSCCPTTEEYDSNNGNIVFLNIGLENDNDHNRNIILTSKNGIIEFGEEPGDSPTCSMYYSDGLLRTHDSTLDSLYGSSTNNIFVFYNENGEKSLVLDGRKIGYYITYVTDFNDGEAYMYFYGKDDNFYVVTIDKQGNWKDTPQKIEKDKLPHGRW